VTLVNAEDLSAHGVACSGTDAMQPIPKFAWLLSLLVLVAGCKGCTKDPEEQAKEDKQKKKLRLVSDELRTLPFSKEIVGNSVKPGHWYQTRQKVKANLNDEALTASLYEIDRDQRPTSLWNMGLPIQFQRDLTIAKGQEKTIEMKVLQTQPRTPSTDSAQGYSGKPSVSIFMRYAQRGLGAPIVDETFMTRILEDYQYDMLVLSRNVPNHIFWRGLDCIVWPLYEPDMRFKVNPHRIIDIAEEEMVQAIPSELMTMTSISHIVINDVSLNILPSNQQQAILDWLHFGGTVIINGPEAIAGIETSFLKDYAPLQKTASGQMSQEHIDSLSDPDTWCLRVADKPALEGSIPFKPNGPISILTGQLGPESSWVPKLEGLVCERLVGQGRIVMTSFPMNHASLINWPSYSSLIHNAILRKPRRDVRYDQERKDFSMHYYEGKGEFERDMRLNTRMRLWARDLEANTSKDGLKSLLTLGSLPKKSIAYGAWNEQSLVTNAAASYLKNLSGISVPNINSIIKWLLAYLAVLVPINWLFFRLIGRLELAWVAAPLIAIAGVFVIAKAVQLDVGFSRSQTSIQLVEVHPDYPRGMLSCYHSLYSSLTTNYKIVYPEGQGVVSPMPQHRQRSLTTRNELLPYRIADEDGSGFQSFPVLSNTIGMVQSEEVVSLGGNLSWNIDQTSGIFEVTNDSAAQVHNVLLLGLNPQGNLFLGQVGTIQSGGGKSQGKSVSVDFRAATKEIEKYLTIEENTSGSSPDQQRDFVLELTLESIMTNYPLQAGEWIAIGWTDANLSKLQITPQTLQTRSTTMVLMHAKAPSLGAIQHDLRLMPPRPKDELEP
jgi:hypothetical protein